MRTTTRAMVVTALFIILGGISTASAQLGQYALRFEMPYDFVVERESFPSGTYRIERMPGTGNPASMLLLRGPDGKAIMFDTIGHESGFGYRDTAITLRRVDGRYYLAKIMIEGQLRGYEVPTSRYRRDRTARTVTIRSSVRPDSGF